MLVELLFLVGGFLMVVLNSIEELDSSTVVILSSVVAQRFVVATSDFAMA